MELSKITPETSHDDSGGESQLDPFLRLCPDVTAISKEAKAPGEAVNLFHESRLILETELERFYSAKKSKSVQALEEVSAKHSILAIIYWLYPNHVGYNRLRNAVKMFQHASAAQATAQSRTALSYSVGQMIQLRITPFLIKSKKKNPGDLAEIRINAENFLASCHRTDLSSIVSDGLGFSYFLFERDFDRVLFYLNRAADNFETWETNNARTCRKIE